MSILLSGRVKIALSALAASVAILFIPASAGANTCGVMSSSFHCMTGVKKSKKRLVKKSAYNKKAAKKSYRVAAIRPTKTVTDADTTVAVAKSGKKASKKASRKIRRLKKARVSRRTVRKMKSTRRTKRRLRRKKTRVSKLRTIGRRINAKSVRKLTKSRLGKRRLTKQTSTKSSRRSAKKSSKRGWRTRGKSLGYRAANRGVSTRCFPKRLKRLLKKVSAHYGRKLVITSGYRSHRHNRRIGGARRSQHIHCTAADFYVPGVNKYTLARYLKRLPGRGGVGTYGGNRIVHLDVGPRRSWHWGRKRRHAGKKRRARRSAISRRIASRRRSAKRRVARLRGSKS